MNEGAQHTPELARVTVREATAADRGAIRRAIVEEQEFERVLHDTRRPGEEIADPYLAWLDGRARVGSGAIFVAEVDGVFAGFVACWVTRDDAIAETRDSNVHGYISDICVLAAFRGHGLAASLLSAAEAYLVRFEISRLRISSLAANRSAQAAYRKYGFEPYEIVFEKRADRR